MHTKQSFIEIQVILISFEVNFLFLQKQTIVSDVSDLYSFLMD